MHLLHYFCASYYRKENKCSDAQNVHYVTIINLKSQIFIQSKIFKIPYNEKRCDLECHWYYLEMLWLLCNKIFKSWAYIHMNHTFCILEKKVFQNVEIFSCNSFRQMLKIKPDPSNSEWGSYWVFEINLCYKVKIFNKTSWYFNYVMSCWK